jgi:hypothetical protein
MKSITADVTGWTAAEIDRAYHPIPDDDGWRAVTLAYVIGHDRRLWLYCNRCQRSQYVWPAEFAAEHGIDLETPLLSIARRIRCTGCGLRLMTVWEEPYSIASDVRGIVKD